MKRLICKLQGHKTVQVREVGVTPRPGGILPSIDGYVAYEPHPDGEHKACTRCRAVPVDSGPK